ncbi:MAG: glycyl-radical enzyme activating protein [Candidatus Humimicrobiaceae bacterium]
MIEKIKGCVFNIEKYHLNDGSGIRTVVFLKGCPCYCPWCSNPESQSLFPRMAIYINKCTKCGNCIKYCQNRANTLDKENITYNRDLCKMCGECIKHCVNNAREIIGKELYLEDVIKEVEKDINFYSRSNGGVTLSGGEPCLQSYFSRNILKICKFDLLINTAVETSGCCDWDSLWETLEYADEILFDIKQTDPILFEKYICSSVSVQTIKNNLFKLISLNKNIIFRYPLIPGFTYDKKNIDTIISWALEMDIKRIDLLPFHQYGRKKYDALNLNYELRDSEKIEENRIEEYKDLILRNKLECLIGG